MGDGVMALVNYLFIDMEGQIEGKKIHMYTMYIFTKNSVRQ